MPRRISSSALRSLATAWSRSGMAGELSSTGGFGGFCSSSSALMTTTAAGAGKGGVRLLSSSTLSSLNLSNLHHHHHRSTPCSRCGSACRCANCCRCQSASGGRGMMTTTTTTSAATTTATTTTSAPTTSSRHPHRRLISSSPSPAAPVVDVTVASMGESISEGTVAAVLKAPGDAVAADEVIAQIETDKVTIDVRAPAAGKVTSLEVKEGESVVVGQVVAKVEEGAEGAVAAEKPAAVAPEKEEPAAVAPVAAVAPAAAPAAAAPSPPPPSSPRRQQQQQNQSPRRKPSISFPARLTRAGVRISSLSASDAREARAAIRAAELDEPELAERLSRGRRAGSNATIPLYVGTERGTKLSASRVLSDREMEMIELGGAAP